MTSPAKIELHRHRGLFSAAIAFFILAKLTFIFLPINALGLPSLGDDALNYLWGGKQILRGYDTSSPALSDILMQHGLDDDPGEQPRNWRARVHFRTIGTHSPLYDLMMAAVLATGLPLKWTFAVSEAIIAVAMGLGIAVFLRILFGAPAAAVGLVLLAFLVLPQQGLTYYIAATLTLSCALMLWTYLLRWGEKANPTITLLAGFFLLGLHPIARIFLFSGVVAWLLTIGPSPRWWHRNVVVIAVGLGFLTIAAQLLPSFFPILGHEAAGETRGFGFGDGFAANLEGVVNAAKYMNAAAISILVLAMAAPFVVGRQKIFSRPVVASLASLAIPLIVSLFYFYAGYQAEIFLRVFVVVVILMAGMVATAVVEFMARDRTRIVRLAAGAGAVVLVLLMIKPWYQEIVNNLGFRPEILNEKAFAGQFARFPDGTTIVYFDADIALNAALLSGGDRLGALAAPMIFGNSSYYRIVNERKPKYAVLPMPVVFNMAHARKSRGLGERRLGIDLQYTGKVLISSKDQPMAEVHLWVTNPGTRAFDLRVFNNPRSPTAPGPGRKIAVPAAHNGWMRIDDGRNQLRLVLVELPHMPGWIEGISIGLPRDHIRWAWKLEHNVAVTRRDADDSQFYHLPLSIPALFKSHKATKMLSLIRREDSVLSDDSGFVFLNTVFSAGK